MHFHKILIIHTYFLFRQLFWSAWKHIFVLKTCFWQSISTIKALIAKGPSCRIPSHFNSSRCKRILFEVLFNILCRQDWISSWFFVKFRLNIVTVSVIWSGCDTNPSKLAQYSFKVIVLLIAPYTKNKSRSLCAGQILFGVRRDVPAGHFFDSHVDTAGNIVSSLFLSHCTSWRFL